MNNDYNLHSRCPFCELCLPMKRQSDASKRLDFDLHPDGVKHIRWHEKNDDIPDEEYELADD